MNKVEITQSQKEFFDQFNNIPEQNAFLQSDAMFNLAVCGRGAGKSTAVVYNLVRYLMHYDGLIGMLVAPTYRMLKHASLVKLKEILTYFPDYIVTQHNKSENWFEFYNGSKLYCKNASNPDAIRGIEVGICGIDEAAFITEEAWLIIMATLRQQKAPNRAFLASTPHSGKGNWLYKHFIESDDKNYSTYSWSSLDNPALPKELLEAWKSSYGEDSKWYEQEILGKFVDFSNTVYSFKNIIDTNPPLKNYKKILAGVDFGIADPSVCIVIGKHKNGDIYVLDEFYERGITTNQFLPNLKEMQKEYGIDKFYADPADANARKILSDGGLNIVQAKNDVLPGISEVLNQQNRIKINKQCVNLLAESQEYSWTTDEKNNPVTSKNPIKGFDHALDALRYVIYTSEVGERHKDSSGGKIAISRGSRVIRV